MASLAQTAQGCFLAAPSVPPLPLQDGDKWISLCTRHGAVLQEHLVALWGSPWDPVLAAPCYTWVTMKILVLIAKHWNVGAGQHWIHSFSRAFVLPSLLLLLLLLLLYLQFANWRRNWLRCSQFVAFFYEFDKWFFIHLTLWIQILLSLLKTDKNICKITSVLY